MHTASSDLPGVTLYRHDSVITQRPYDFDVDEDGWLWEGSTGNRLMEHNLRTAELDLRIVPEMGGHVVFAVFCWRGKLVMVLHDAPFYLVYDTATRRCERKAVPTPGAIVWYGCKLPGDRLMVCNRGTPGSGGEAWIFDAPDAPPRIIPVPYRGDFASATLAEDGLTYTFMGDPARVVRFDPRKEQFVDERPLPWPEVGVSGRVSHEGVLYCADSSGGRLLSLELATQRWLDPIVHPDHGKVFGFIGQGFKARGRLYYCLSTYAHRSRLDLKTGKIILPPPGTKMTVDGREPPRFMEKLLTFDPATRAWGYLEAPPQGDGVPLLCYAWSDGTDFAVTGMVLPLESPGVPRYADGPWLILQSKPADRVPTFGEYDLARDRLVVMQARRRSYPRDRALYLAEEPHTPALAEFGGAATAYDVGRNAELLRRAAATDPGTYWSEVIKRVVAPDGDDAAKVRAVLAHVQRYVYYNPIQVPQTFDPIAIHEAREGRCGHGVSITLELLKAAGVEARQTVLQNHVVAEARYGGAWHIADALFFGADQPSRGGRVLSVEELKAEPYFADAYPQRCFAYDPELLMSDDGYQVLGYVFGVWGSEPYYSFYLGAPKDLPPTMPTMLPAQRVGARALRLNWTRSLKADVSAAIEYELRVCTDRACTQEIFRTLTRDTHADFDVPAANRMYFAEVRAMDEHRRLNPDTWYPWAKWNFVPAPVGQYGWYGVL